MPTTMMSGSWTPLGLLITILFFVFISASLVWLVLLVARTQSGGATAPRSALAILEERLARGEIGVDDYRARRDAIEAAR